MCKPAPDFLGLVANPDHQASIASLLAVFQPGRTVAVCSHVGPDGDAIGSVMALAAWLEARGLTVTRLLAAEQQPPAVYDFLPEYDFLAAERYHADPDIFVAVDLSQAHRLEQAEPILQRARLRVNIDHHPGYDGFADLLLADPAAAATGLLVWELILASEQTPTPAMATACYVAVLTDTGRFTYESTTAATLAAASTMVAAGADAPAIANTVFESRPLGVLQLSARLTERICHPYSDQVVLSWLTPADLQELGVAREETENLVSLLRSIQGVELAILLRQESEHIRVNLRARGDYDAARMARDFGGGGHRAAAGFNFDGSLEQAQAAIQEYLQRQADPLLAPSGGLNSGSVGTPPSGE